MPGSQKLWIPLLAALLFVGALGVGGDGATAVEPRLTKASIMVPAAAFIPTSPTTKFYNSGSGVSSESGTANLFAPVSFPVPVVNIKKITVYAYDNSASQLCVSILRTRPADAGQDLQASLCTVDGSAPQYMATADIAFRRVVTANHGVYLGLGFYGSGVTLYGVKIDYSY